MPLGVFETKPQNILVISPKGGKESVVVAAERRVEVGQRNTLVRDDRRIGETDFSLFIFWFSHNATETASAFGQLVINQSINHLFCFFCSNHFPLVERAALWKNWLGRCIFLLCL